MPYLSNLLAGITFAPLGWPLAWLVAHTYRRVSDCVAAARLRLLVMAFLGISPAVLLSGVGYHPPEQRYMLGALMAFIGFPTGWMLIAAVIEHAIRVAKVRRATAS